MYYQYKLGVFFVLVTGLLSCGGGEESQQPNLASPPENVTPILPPEKELTTDEIVADPSATFKTSKKINYSAFNETTFNITLFITNIGGTELARYYIKAGDFIDISVQLDAAATEIDMRWHYLEHIKKERALVAELSHVNFNGF
ncbi:MAG TPA: hypothetical protein DIS98_10830 [Colwellia sp.]|nr:hypothetical protein [Colwellia sp.]